MATAPAQFDPSKFLTSTTRALHDYALSFFDPTLVEVQMGYPPLAAMLRKGPLSKTIVHFELDQRLPVTIGFGTIVAEENFNEVDESVLQSTWEVWHDLLFDVGIWASIETGASTSRLEVHETLCHAFCGPAAYERLRDYTQGLMLKAPGIAGGRYILDSFADIPVWRAADIFLPIRVSSMYVPPAYEPALMEVELDLDLYDVDGNLLGP